MSPSTLNFAIIGCGRIAPRHAQALLSLHESHAANLKATFDVIESRAQNIAKEYGAVAYPSYQSILEDLDIHVVSVCVPSGLHMQVAQEAARAGKHVLVEKPIALSVADADALIETAEQCGITLGVVLQNRFNPPPA